MVNNESNIAIVSRIGAFSDKQGSNNGGTLSENVKKEECWGFRVLGWCINIFTKFRYRKYLSAMFVSNDSIRASASTPSSKSLTKELPKELT